MNGRTERAARERAVPPNQQPNIHLSMSDQQYETEALISVKRRLATAQSERVTEYTCLDRTFVVHDGVFPPTHFQSTGIFTRHLPYRRGASFLEIGCGTGVTAVTAALEGCRPVVAALSPSNAPSLLHRAPARTDRRSDTGRPHEQSTHEPRGRPCCR